MIKLIGFFVSGIASVLAALVAFSGRKTVVSALALSTFVAVTVAFIFCIKSLVTLLSNALLMPAWLAPIAWFLPLNFIAVFSALISGHICRAAYDIAVAKIKMVSSSS